MSDTAIVSEQSGETRSRGSGAGFGGGLHNYGEGSKIGLGRAASFLFGIGGAMKTSKQIVKLVAFGVALTCLFACAAGVLVACDKQIEPHDVEIVLINPHTGEPMSRKEYIEEPPAGTPIEVKIKDLVTGEYLTDDDLPETTLADSLSIGILRFMDWDYNGAARVQNSVLQECKIIIIHGLIEKK